MTTHSDTFREAAMEKAAAAVDYWTQYFEDGARWAHDSAPLTIRFQIDPREFFDD